MALTTKPHPQESAIWCKEQKIVSIEQGCSEENVTAHGFACIQVLSPDFINYCKVLGYKNIMDVYRYLLKKKAPLYALSQDCFFSDLGSPQRYWQAHMRIFSELENKKKTRGIIKKINNFLNHQKQQEGDFESFCSTSYNKSKKKQLGDRSVVYGPASIAETCRFNHSIVLPNSNVQNTGQSRGIFCPQEPLFILCD